MRAVLAVALALAVTGCNFGDDEEPSALERADFVVDLDKGSTLESDEGLGGVALTERGAKTLVTIEVADPPGPTQQAEIRRGNCDVIDVAVAYRLSPVEDGLSETVVDVPLRELRRAGYLVMVHDVPSEEQLGALCGDLARSQPPSAAPTFD